MKASVARKRYSNPVKTTPRDLVMALARDVQAETVLDLWGGGISARAFREAVPDAAVVSCETDPELWPTLRLDAQVHGYVPHLGDVATAAGKYDLIWLDLCSQWSGSARTTIHRAAAKLTERGAMAVTLMAAREAPEIAADRLFLVPLSIERASGLHVQVLYPYQTGSPMWLLILRPGKGRFWTDVHERTVRITGKNIDNWRWSHAPSSPFDMVLEDLAADGFWCSPFDRSPAIHDLLEEALAARAVA